MTEQLLQVAVVWLTQMSLFGPPEGGPEPKPPIGQLVRLNVLITVKAASNPSERYGETVCVAGLSTDLQRRGWIRLYPINFRELASDDRFRKYDVVTVNAKPNPQDQRRESFRPIMETMVTDRHLEPWKPRRALLDEYVEDSMCRLNRAAQANANAQSLALVRPRTVDGLVVEAHPGWTPDEQRKIDVYITSPTCSAAPTARRSSHPGSVRATGITAMNLAAAATGKASWTGNWWLSSGVWSARATMSCAA
ncbi:hypothetical protein [Actinoplanes sp. NPDC049599]|uniref:hypothetical protein n=1 Tax=Actinoplanes sp. NPDC049599 TaxID=3363903 RepID=UPI003798D54F